MGAFLDKPKTEKQTSTGSGNGLKYGVSSMQGWRLEMEDAHCALLGLQNGLQDWSFFAVFDGHAGPKVSAFCAQNLLESITTSDQFKSNATSLNGHVTDEQIASLKTGIREGFLKLDERMKTLPEVEEDKSGSTAVCVILSTQHFFFVNCGDSRAVLSRAGVAYLATQDHKPINPEEKERIQRAGGSVMIQRVNGSLAVSRALGDYEYKNVEGKGPCEQLVSPEPEITVLERDPATDEFLVLACDGIWDVMSNEDLCAYVRYLLTIQSSLEAVCSSIIDTCLHKGSKDNMSIVLVTFDAAPKVSEESLKKDAELNALLTTKVQDLLKDNSELTVNGVMQSLMGQDLPDLPPGGGLDAKRAFIESICEKQSSSSGNQNGSSSSSSNITSSERHKENTDA